MTWRLGFAGHARSGAELGPDFGDHICREIAYRVRAVSSESTCAADAIDFRRARSVKSPCRDCAGRPPFDLWADVRFAVALLALNGLATAGAILHARARDGRVEHDFHHHVLRLCGATSPFERPRSHRIQGPSMREAENPASLLPTTVLAAARRRDCAPPAARAIGAITWGARRRPSSSTACTCPAYTFHVPSAQAWRSGREFSAVRDRPGAESLITFQQI